MTVRDHLRALAEALPADGAATVPVAWLRDLLEQTSSTPVADLTVAELAVAFHRKPSAVRGWLEAGRFPGAYKLRGREWRVPSEALEGFRANERQGKTPDAGASGDRPAGGLGDWRSVRRGNGVSTDIRSPRSD